MHFKIRLASLAAVLSFFATAQNAPRFEAASIRPTEHGKASSDAVGYSFVDVADPGHLRAQNSNLDELVRFAWGLKDGDISGPAWLTDSFTAFDITDSAGERFERSDAADDENSAR
jgi:uncharacterized protein (TIGR03435 family)